MQFRLFLFYLDSNNLYSNYQISLTAKSIMLEDYKLDSISKELNIFLAASARKNAFIPKPLVLKAQFKNIPAVSDHENRVYEINMNELTSFRDLFTDKQCKFLLIQANMFDSMNGSSI